MTVPNAPPTWLRDEGSELGRFLSPSSFVEPDFVDPASAWAAHIPFAFWIVEACRPRTLVELGTHTGVSYFALCQAVDRLGLGTRCFAVDTWEGDEQTGFYGEDVYAAVVARNHRYGSFSTLVRSSFDEAAPSFADGSIDLLHLDGLHTYAAVRHDIDTWLPKLSKRGIALFHDTSVRERNFGVWRVWAELLADYPGFEFVHGHGLGVLAVGADIGEPLADLARTDGAEPPVHGVRVAYTTLGAGVEQRVEAIRLSLRLQELERAQQTQVEELARAHQTQVEELAREQDELHELLEQERSELRKLSSKLKKRERQVRKLRSSRDELTDSLQAQLAERDRELNEHREQLTMVLQSASWRVTRPLRSSKQGLRRVAARAGVQTLPGVRHLRSHKDARARTRTMRMLVASDWYRTRYGLASRSDPLRDYLDRGFAIGRDPSPLFDSDWYRSQNADLPEDVAPLADFVDRGPDLGLAPNRYFDPLLWLTNTRQGAETTAEYLARVAPPMSDPRTLSADKDVLTGVQLGEQALSDGDELCVYAHYDPDELVDEYAVETLDELAAAGLKIIFATTCRRLGDDQLGALLPRTAVVLTTRNEGRDWGLYHAGLRFALEQIAPDAVLLLNDSMYSHLRPFWSFMESVRGVGANIVGATDSYEQRYHVQSYFLRLDRSALESGLVDEFLAHYVPVAEKQYIINAYEIGLGRRAEELGLTLAAVHSYDVLEGEARRLPADDLRGKLARQGVLMNPTHYFWDLLLARGHPFIKIELLRDNPAGLDLRPLQLHLPDADPRVWNVIEEHLRRTGKPAAVLPDA